MLKTAFLNYREIYKCAILKQNAIFRSEYFHFHQSLNKPRPNFRAPHPTCSLGFCLSSTAVLIGVGGGGWESRFCAACATRYASTTPMTTPKPLKFVTSFLCICHANLRSFDSRSSSFKFNTAALSLIKKVLTVYVETCQIVSARLHSLVRVMRSWVKNEINAKSGWFQTKNLLLLQFVEIEIWCKCITLFNV